MAVPDRSHLLNEVYTAGDLPALTAQYDARAGDYDRDVQQHGYITPSVVVELAARYVARGDGPILDAGAGTGIAGEMLSLFGYSDLVAIDISDGMLTVARAKGVYSDLHRMELGKALDFPDDEFAATVAVGVFTIGHASPEGFHELLRVTRPGGHLVFNVNAEAYESGGFREAQENLEHRGRWELMEKTQPFVGVPRRSPSIKTIGFVYRVS